MIIVLDFIFILFLRKQVTSDFLFISIFTSIFILQLTVLNMEKVLGKSENYTVMKIVSGSFHQGNVEKFQESAGLQCGINCMTATCCI